MPDYYYGLCDVMGAWMDKNKESLLGVKGGPWPERVNVPVTTKGKVWYLFAWPQNDQGGFSEPKSGAMGKYDYTPKEKIVKIKNVGEAPASARILATGEDLGYTLEGKTMTFVIPKETSSSNLDVIKVEWK